MTTYRKILRTGTLVTSLMVAGATVQAAAQGGPDQGVAGDRDHRGGFDNWGLLGLLGLAGLMGRKRDRDVTRTGAVPNSGRL
jgi:hypothetical protein